MVGFFWHGVLLFVFLSFSQSTQILNRIANRSEPGAVCWLWECGCCLLSIHSAKLQWETMALLLSAGLMRDVV